jgi:hypothetical protein
MDRLLLQTELLEEGQGLRAPREHRLGTHVHRDAVDGFQAELATEPVRPLEKSDLDVVSRPAELPGGRQTADAPADDRDPSCHAATVPSHPERPMRCPAPCATVGP